MLPREVPIPITETFRDDHAARQYLASAMEDAGLLPEALLPPHKWMQAIFLTDAGKLKASAEHLAGLLGIPASIAKEVVRRLATMDGMAAIAEKMRAGLERKPVIAVLVGSLFLLSQSLQLDNVGFNTALVGLA